MSLQEFEKDKVSKGSFMFNFNKEPDSWIKKIKNGLKTSEAAILFIVGIVTGYFLYNLLPLSQIFSLFKNCLEWGFGIGSFIMLFYTGLELNEFPENPLEKRRLAKRFYKKAAIGIGMASVATLLSVI